MSADWALPDIDLAKCDLCGICVERCSTGAAEMGARGPYIARPADCTFCAHCETICPQGAIACRFEIVWGEVPSTGSEPAQAWKGAEHGNQSC
jgi:ferredoxin